MLRPEGEKDQAHPYFSRFIHSLCLPSTGCSHSGFVLGFPSPFFSFITFIWGRLIFPKSAVWAWPQGGPYLVPLASHDLLTLHGKLCYDGSWPEWHVHEAVSGGQPVSPEPLTALVNKHDVECTQLWSETSQDSRAVILQGRSLSKLITFFATSFIAPCSSLSPPPPHFISLHSKK